MERRSEPRFGTNAPVRISVLGEQPRELAGELENVSGKGMRLLIDEPLTAGTPVKLELDETVLLGEVCYLEGVGARYAVGIQLEHVFQHTEELARLSKKLLELAAAPDGEPAHTRPRKPEDR